jgi:O-antigen/teichoic acid export membrane protein
MSPHRWSSLGLKVVHSFGGNAAYALCQWFLLVALARLGGVGGVGDFSLGLAVSAPIFLLFGFQVRAIQATDVRGEYPFGDVLSLRIASSAAAFSLVMVVSIAGYHGVQARTIAAVALMKAFESVSDVYHGDLQRREQMDWISFWLILKGAGSVIVLGVLVRLFHSVAAGAAGAAAVFGSALFFGEAVFNAPSARLCWNQVNVTGIVRRALPLGISMMLISLNTNIPRYFLEHAFGSKALGLFAPLTYLVLAGNTVMSAIGQAAMPRLAKLRAAQDASGFRTILGQMIGCGALLGTGSVIVMAIWGRRILTSVYGMQYAEHTQLAVWIVAAGGISYLASALGYGLTAAGCLRPQLPLFGVLTAVVLTTSAFWIPRFGLNGAAAVLMTAACAQFLGAAGLMLGALRQKPTQRLRHAEATA